MLDVHSVTDAHEERRFALKACCLMRATRRCVMPLLQECVTLKAVTRAFMYKWQGNGEKKVAPGLVELLVARLLDSPRRHTRQAPGVSRVLDELDKWAMEAAQKRNTHLTDFLRTLVLSNCHFLFDSL